MQVLMILVGTFRHPTLLLYLNPDKNVLFTRLCMLCKFFLDFGAGLASLGSSDVTVLYKLTKGKTPDGLKHH